jgi:DNA invertase Pin-like site-specific DNA recombinase
LIFAIPESRTLSAPPPRLVGYARVSTDDQNADLQVEALNRAGVNEHHIFVEVDSGRNAKREQLLMALKACRFGGTLLVWKLDRLGRNTSELINTVQRLHQRGINFRSLTQSEINTDNMRTATGALIFNVFAALAQFESDQIAERTRAGQAIAKANGKRFGRKRFDELYSQERISEFQTLRASGMTVVEACARTGIPRSTYLKYLSVFNADPVDDIGPPDDETITR